MRSTATAILRGREQGGVAEVCRGKEVERRFHVLGRM